MSRDDELLDAADVRELLIELGGRLADQGVDARIFIVGGVAMALAFNTRRLTRDIDAVFEPKTVIYKEAARMAAERVLPPDWLNDGVKGLLPGRVQPQEGTASFTARGIHVGVASAEYMFAMKAQAARQEADGDDLRELTRQLGLRDAEAGLDLVERFYGPGRLTPKTQLMIESIVGEVAVEQIDDSHARPQKRRGPGSNQQPDRLPRP